AAGLAQRRSARDPQDRSTGAAASCVLITLQHSTQCAPQAVAGLGPRRPRCGYEQCAPQAVAGLGPRRPRCGYGRCAPQAVAGLGPRRPRCGYERRQAMYTVPDVDEVVAVAKELGIHLSADEAVLYQKHLAEQLSQLDAFVQARIEEPRPPMVSAARTPGYRPRAGEDPLNAWMWKCRIEGSADGLLKGKTVSFKDHIAIAGMPMSFGSFALEGFVPDFDATVVTRV